MNWFEYPINKVIILFVNFQLRVYKVIQMLERDSKRNNVKLENIEFYLPALYSMKKDLYS